MPVVPDLHSKYIFKTGTGRDSEIKREAENLTLVSVL